MKNYIIETLKEAYRNCKINPMNLTPEPTDLEIDNLFGRKLDDVLIWNDKHKLLRIETIFIKDHISIRYVKGVTTHELRVELNRVFKTQNSNYKEQLRVLEALS